MKRGQLCATFSFWISGYKTTRWETSVPVLAPNSKTNIGSVTVTQFQSLKASYAQAEFYCHHRRRMEESVVVDVWERKSQIFRWTDWFSSPASSDSRDVQLLEDRRPSGFRRLQLHQTSFIWDWCVGAGKLWNLMGHGPPGLEMEVTAFTSTRKRFSTWSDKFLVVWSKYEKSRMSRPGPRRPLGLQGLQVSSIWFRLTSHQRTQDRKSYMSH